MSAAKSRCQARSRACRATYASGECIRSATLQQYICTSGEVSQYWKMNTRSIENNTKLPHDRSRLAIHSRLDHEITNPVISHATYLPAESSSGPGSPKIAYGMPGAATAHIVKTWYEKQH